MTLKEIHSSIELCYFAGSLSYAPWVLGTFYLLKVTVTCDFSPKCLFNAVKNKTSLQFDQPLYSVLILPLCSWEIQVMVSLVNLLNKDFSLFLSFS